MMDHADANLRDMLQLGIKAAQAKHKTEAYQLLSQVVRRDPGNEQGWLWLAAVAPTAQESLDAFTRVLAINPANEQARVGQRWASARLAPPAPTAAPPDAPSAPAGFQPDAPAPPSPASGPATVFAPTTGAVAAEATAGADLPSAPSAPPADTWRAAGDLTVQGSGVNWDDSGADLDGLNSLSDLDSGSSQAGAVTCPNCGAPGQTGAYCTHCHGPLVHPSTDAGLDPSLRGVVYTPNEAAAHDAAAESHPRDLPAEYGPLPVPYSAAIRPVGRRASLMPLLLGGLLLLAGLLLALNGLLKTAGPDEAAQQFFKAHLQKDYSAAALLLDRTQQDAYMPTKDLPDLNLNAALAGVPAAALQPPAPLAVSPDPSKAGSQAESYITIQPPGKPPLRYLVHLTRNNSGKWLIDEILPAPSVPAANP
ncbi:MAG: hypothetical protein M3Z04_02420 [Chloroflexota bacterium]|nr:hypothetical protein [Chloroflexota bacterium]